MAATVIVNKLSVVHKKSDGKSIASPDPCLTPSPPVPVPYVNVAFSKDLADHARTVFADGEGIALSDSNFSTSVGDEPGTAGGLGSSVNKGKATFLYYRMDHYEERKHSCGWR